VIVNDEKISAYLDGELDAAETAAIETEIGQSPTLAERVRRARELDRALASAFAPVLNEPVPQRLLDLVANHPMSGLAAAPASLAEMRARRDAASAWSRFRPWASLVAVAASLAAGFMIGTLRQPSLSGALGDGLSAASPLAAVLDSTPSGQTARTHAGGSVKPRTSFMASNGSYCREFDLQSGQASAAGVACRGQDGWRVEVLAATGDSADRGLAGHGYAMAAGSAAPAVEAALRALGAGDPLDAAGEAQAIAGGWVKP